MGQKIKAYKGFDKDLSCRGFKYEVGKEYEETGDIKACEKVFMHVLTLWMFLVTIRQPGQGFVRLSRVVK